MGSRLMEVLLSSSPNDPVKVPNPVDPATAQTAKSVWAVVSPYLVWVLVALGVALAVVGVVLLVRWWRKRRPSAADANGPPPMSPNRLLQVRQKFLNGLPFANRAAVVDLPNIVVLGPAASGKTQLVGLDVDYQRQARQFLPSYTADALLQMYLGPDCVVQEVSAPLLEDETPQARGALRRMWSRCFSERQKGLAVIVLDVRWLAETPPSEQRRMAQLLRGKLNLVSEASRAPVETRICLTHMDGLEGFEDFARLLKKHGVALSFDIPKRGEEGQLASLLGGQEQYLALGLTSLPVDAFERLERFYSQGGRSFAGLGRFASALLEGDTLSFQPRLSKVFLSSPTPEARASGTLSVLAEQSNVESLRRHYLQTHLRRAAIITAVGCLPVLAAYANFYALLGEARQKVERFERTVDQMREQEVQGRVELVEGQVNDAADAIRQLLNAARWWPPLRTSFPKEMLDLRQRLAQGIRESHLKPALAHCHEEPADCRPEQVVYLLAALHASNGNGLGAFVNASIPQASARRWRPGADEVDASGAGKGRSWISALDLREPLVGIYVFASDEPWARTQSCRPGPVQASGTAEDDWSCWPYPKRLTVEDQLAPWLEHIRFLQRTLESGPDALAQLGDEKRKAERERMKAQLAELDTYTALPKVLSLLDLSGANVSTRNFQGIESTVEVLDKLKENQEVLSAVLRMEEEAYDGYLQVQKMSASELLTREGLWLTGNNKGPYHIELLQQSVDFHPPQLSRDLLQALLDSYVKHGKLTIGAHDSNDAQLILTRAPFDSDLKPLVDDFTQRLKNVQMPIDEAAKRGDFIQRRVNAFSDRYLNGLYYTMANYHSVMETPWPNPPLLEALSRLSQPSSKQVEMLRDVANRANLEPLDGPYYDPLRKVVATFKPIVQIMKADKEGAATPLEGYQKLLAKMHDDLAASSLGKAKAADDAGGGKGDGADKDKAAVDDGGKAAKASGGPGDLTDMLSPLQKVALSMLLEEDGSYLRQVQDWLDKQNITGPLRQPFLEPFLRVRQQGKQELEAVIAKQWEDESGRVLRPLLDRYPFNPSSKEEVDPGELDVLKRRDGDFWHFADRIFSRICVERGTEWSLRGPLRDNKLILPDGMLTTLSKLSKLSKLLWDDDGRPRPLLLKVQPQPLPKLDADDLFFTEFSLKCGAAIAKGKNEKPMWRDFLVTWWDQQVASLVVTTTSPSRGKEHFQTLVEKSSPWSCFRVLEATLPTSDQRRKWDVVLQNDDDETVQSMNQDHPMEISFGLKGQPWAPFREVPR